MPEISKSSVYRLLKVLIASVVLGIALAMGVDYWAEISLGVSKLVQQIPRIQQRLISVSYILHKRVAEQEWARQLFSERDWLVRNWLIWGGLGGVVLPVIIFFVAYGRQWWRLLLPPSPCRDDQDWWMTRLIWRKVIQAHWRTNRFNLEQAVLNMSLLGLSCFSLQLVIHSYILPSRNLVRAGMLSFLCFSYACCFFYLYIKRHTIHQVAGMLDDKLQLKQELVTSLDGQLVKHSSLGHFLLSDTAAKLEYKSIPRLFPYHSHRLKVSHFLIQLGLILLGTLVITLGGLRLASSYYTKGERRANPQPESKMEGVINQQAQQIKLLSNRLERQLPSPFLPGVVSELDQLAEEMSALGGQPGDLGMGAADGGGGYHGMVMSPGSYLAVSGIGASLSPPSNPGQLAIPGAGSAASPLIPQGGSQNGENQEGDGDLTRISGRLTKIAQQLTGLAGGANPSQAEVNRHAAQGERNAKETPQDGPSLSRVAERLDRLAKQLQEAQLSSSGQVFRENLWIEGEELAQLAHQLSQWEAARTASTEQESGGVGNGADLGKLKFEIRMVSSKLSQSAQRLREWDAIAGAGASQREVVQLLPYSGQYGPGEASIISGERNQPFSPEANPQPKLRIERDSAPHSHAQLTNMSLDNSYHETAPEGEESRRAIITRGYNQGASAHPAQVKLGGGQREQPPSGVTQVKSSMEPGVLAAKRLNYGLAPGEAGETIQLGGADRQSQAGQHKDDQQMATSNPDNQYLAWGKELAQLPLNQAEVADKGIMGNPNQLDNQFTSRADYTAPMGNRSENVSSADKGEVPSNFRELSGKLDRLSTELVSLTKDDAERRLLAKSRPNLRDYQSNEQYQVPIHESLDSRDRVDQNGGLSRAADIPEGAQVPERKLAKELKEVADDLVELTENRTGTDGRSEPETIIEKGIQKINQINSKLKSQIEPSQQLDSITDELGQLAQGLSQLQPYPSNISPPLEGGALPTAMEQMPSLQIPTQLPTGGVNSSKAQHGKPDKQNNAAVSSRPQGHIQDRIKQQLALTKLDSLIDKLRQLQSASSGKGATGAIDQPPTDFSSGIDQQDTPKGGSELEHTPREGVISSPYPMEENLTQDEVFEQIIRRLAESRRRIAQFPISPLPPTSNLAGQIGSRKGNLSQPDLPKVRGLTQWEKQQGITRSKTISPPNRFPPNQLISFRDPQQTGKYAQVSIRAQASPDGPHNHKPRPSVPLSTPAQLHLTAEQQADNSVRQQLIPQNYQQIIRRLYQSGP